MGLLNSDDEKKIQNNYTRALMKDIVNGVAEMLTKHNTFFLEHIENVKRDDLSLFDRKVSKASMYRRLDTVLAAMDNGICTLGMLQRISSEQGIETTFVEKVVDQYVVKVLASHDEFEKTFSLNNDNKRKEVSLELLKVIRKLGDNVSERVNKCLAFVEIGEAFKSQDELKTFLGEVSTPEWYSYVIQAAHSEANIEIYKELCKLGEYFEFEKGNEKYFTSWTPRKQYNILMEKVERFANSIEKWNSMYQEKTKNDFKHKTNSSLH